MEYLSLIDGASSQSASANSTRGVTRHGKPSPPYEIKPTDNDGMDTGPVIPVGHTQALGPSSPATNLTAPSGYGGYGMRSLHRRQSCTKGQNVNVFGSVVFDNNTGDASEPSGASAGRVVFTVANWGAAASFDGGFTFSLVDPSRYADKDPVTNITFCCDQIVQYLPTIDRFVWLLQYVNDSATHNKLRIITFRPVDLTSTGPSTYLYIDIRSTDLGLTNILDAGDLAVGGEHLWLSVNNLGTGLVVMQFPFSALSTAGSFTYWYTDATVGAPAYLSRVAQNSGDIAYWAGHSELGTTMRVFRWPESGTTYFWSDVRIRDWPGGGTYFSGCPSNHSLSWLFTASNSRIIGATRRLSNEVWFAWNSPSGDGFPNVHIQIAQIDVSSWPTLRLIQQPQIWNADFAYAYPSFYTNQCGDVGTAVMFGGGTFQPSSAVTVLTPAGVLTSTVYYPELSTGCEDRNGDYLTVRSADGVDFQGFVYDKQSDRRGNLHGESRIIGFSRG